MKLHNQLSILLWTILLLLKSIISAVPAGELSNIALSRFSPSLFRRQFYSAQRCDNSPDICATINCGPCLLASAAGGQRRRGTEQGAQTDQAHPWCYCTVRPKHDRDNESNESCPSSLDSTNDDSDYSDHTVSWSSYSCGSESTKIAGSSSDGSAGSCRKWLPLTFDWRFFFCVHTFAIWEL